MKGDTSMHTTSGGTRRGAPPHAATSGRARRAAWYNLGLAAGIPLGEGRVFTVAGTDVAVFRTRGGELFATQPRCPHRGGPLADGIVGGGAVVCPLHARRFDLATGEVLGGGHPCAALTTYPVQLGLDGSILLSLAAHAPTEAPSDAEADAA
jgi:nitrite reductase (NADH) small subunit